MNQPQKTPPHRGTVTPCPHCGRALTARLLSRHTEECARAKAFPLPPSPSHEADAPDTGAIDEVVQIQRLLAQSSWLTRRQEELLTSFLEQLAERGHTRLSVRQREVLEEIAQAVDRRQEPHFFRGGSPGTGRRA